MWLEKKQNKTKQKQNKTKQKNKTKQSFLSGRSPLPSRPVLDLSQGAAIAADDLGWCSAQGGDPRGWGKNYATKCHNYSYTISDYECYNKNVAAITTNIWNAVTLHNLYCIISIYIYTYFFIFTRCTNTLGYRDIWHVLKYGHTLHIWISLDIFDIVEYCNSLGMKHLNPLDRYPGAAHQCVYINIYLYIYIYGVYIYILQY